MKLECTVTQIANGGETMTIGLSGRQPNDAEWRRNNRQEIEVVCSDKMKGAFWLGRRVVVTVEPR